MVNLLDYFDVRLTWKDDTPHFKLILREELKITKTPLFRSDGRPISGAEESYFVNYLGEVGKEVYAERKKLFSKNKMIEWYLETFECDQSIRVKLIDSLKVISKNLSIAQNRTYEGENGLKRRAKQREHGLKYAESTAAKNRLRWENDLEWKTEVMQKRRDRMHYERASIKSKEKYSDPEFKKWFIEVINRPERIEAIRKHSIEMWRQFKDGESDRYKNTLGGSRNRNFLLNGNKMNLIEFLVGSTLNDLNLDWEYELTFKFGKKWYIPDFYISKYNLIVECFGDYWHGNPLYFSGDRVIHGTKLVKDFWEYDLTKRLTFEKNGYKFISFWETDINNNIDICREQLVKAINHE